ncbi:HlyD family efflux transporter periplasmic adaptor subunit [Synechococcus sp. PCC 6312]|uniref:HlyD family efflux transporter periplasmic adaptor subunit n=1 Tax=Synechococcus sp. (strain ATCC 27167 / PCC 6312) TaxID=195253 RepID=UPI00029F0F6B|nr:HlyD family efflux transporter periplasmic adaptor subunit [Synechococcus sp. PCC 6312]AFY60715.1 ABC exporter membrane fusion protein, DevB family [Synechococcus sp. PCC 6312]
MLIKLKPKGWKVPALVGSLLVVTGGIIAYGASQVAQFSQANGTSEMTATPSPPAQVTALGRLEPLSEVIQVAAPLALDGDRVAELRVKRGDRVKTGQVIAVLDSAQRLQAALNQAQQEVQVAQARLAQVKAGAKSGEIQAQQATITRVNAELDGTIATQKATIARWQSQVRTAQSEYERFNAIYQEGAISTSQLDAKRLDLETAQAQLKEAQAALNRSMNTLAAQQREANATLDRIAEVRPVDIQVAQAEVERAIANQRQLQTQLEQAYIRSPINGTVLKVHVQPGESLGDEGIVSLGTTQQMMVVAEVYQTDIARVRPGQVAEITGQAFADQLTGTVVEIGQQVERQAIFSNEPGENLDRRVVEVKIQLSPESSPIAARFSNLQVQTAIQVSEPVSQLIQSR